MDKHIKTPKVSVLMPVYNGEKHLRQAIESVLGQSFSDIEFIIINDGSKDGSAAIVRSYNDGRIIFVENESNMGIVATLNKGIGLAKGEYIVRMDCDDICKLSRLQEQVIFMDLHPEVGASGTFYELLINDKKALADFPVNNDEIVCFLLFNSPIAHPTAIIRKKILDEYHIDYDPEYIHTEDYHLWASIAKKSKLANIPIALLEYRVHPHQITAVADAGSDKYNSLLKIRREQLNNLGINFSEEELVIHQKISSGFAVDKTEEFEQVQKWLIKLLMYNKQYGKLNETCLSKIIVERYMRVCISLYGFKRGWKQCRNSELYAKANLSFSTKWQLMKSFYYSFKRRKIRQSL